MNKQQLSKAANYWIRKGLTNRFVLAGLAFLCWVTFFDNSRLISQVQLDQDIALLNEQKQEYIDKIDRIDDEQAALESNKEGYVREHYFSARENEKIFIVSE
jgi:hypothetical protein